MDESGRKDFLRGGWLKLLAFRGSSFCDRVQKPEPPSPLRGEGWDGGDKVFIVHPHPDPPPSTEGEGILGRVKSTFV